MAGSSPLDVCISTTTSPILARTSSGWWTTRSGPSATIASSSSVTRVAISTMTSDVWSSPVISRSIQASTARDYDLMAGGSVNDPSSDRGNEATTSTARTGTGPYTCGNHSPG